MSVRADDSRFPICYGRRTNLVHLERVLKPIIVGMHEAKTHFSKLVRLAAGGQEVIVTNAGRPVAKIVGYEPVAAARTPGLLAGRIVIKPGFDELPPGFEQVFGSR